MNDMLHPEMNESPIAKSDVLSSIRRILAADTPAPPVRGANTAVTATTAGPEADSQTDIPRITDIREAALRRRLAGTCRSDPPQTVPVAAQTAVPDDRLAATEREELRSLVMAARQSFNRRTEAAPLRLDINARVAPAAMSGIADQAAQRGMRLSCPIDNHEEEVAKEQVALSAPDVPAAPPPSGARLSDLPLQEEHSEFPPPFVALHASSEDPENHPAFTAEPGPAYGEPVHDTWLAATPAEQPQEQPVAPAEGAAQDAHDDSADKGQQTVLRDLIREVVRQELHAELGGEDSRGLQHLILREVVAAVTGDAAGRVEK